MVTSAFSVASVDIFHCDWFLFPMNIQRMLPVIIQNARQPVYFRGFGNVICTREAFKGVANLAFSYFFILRQFGYWKPSLWNIHIELKLSQKYNVYSHTRVTQRNHESWAVCIYLCLLWLYCFCRDHDSQVRSGSKQ